MYFAAGKLIEYERMMKQKPGFDRRSVRTMRERDCRNCLYYDEQSRKCSREKCVVFND